MLNNEQRQKLAELLAKSLRKDEADYIAGQYKEPESCWTDQLVSDLEGWITQFNNDL